MSLAIQSLDLKTNTLILVNKTNDQGKTSTIHTYSALSKTFWEAIRCLIEVFTCGCYHFEPFLQIHSVYVLPSQIQESCKQLEIAPLQTKISQESLSTLIANIQECPIERVEKASEVERPVRIRVLGPHLRISQEKVTAALFAQRSFSKTQYVCQEPCDAALIIDAIPYRIEWPEILKQYEETDLKDIPKIFLFVDCFAGETPSRLNFLSKEHLPKNSTSLILLSSQDEVTGVDPSSTQCNQWNIDTIKKFHSFIKEQLPYK